MFPSSNRVKLNRVALKDVIGLEQAPRRRRVPTSLDNVTADTVSEPVSVKDTVCSSCEPVRTVFTDRVGSENVTGTAGNIPGEKPEESCVGTQKTNKRNNAQWFTGNHSKEFKQYGPYTKGKCRQSKPNTRSGGRMDRLRLSFTRCFCSASDSVQTFFKPTGVHCPVRSGRHISEISRQTKLNRKALPQSYVEAPESQILSDLESSMGKLSGKSESRQRNIKYKTRVPLVAGRDRGIESQSKLKATFTGWDPQHAAANTGQVATGTRSMHTGLSKIDSNIHPSPTGLARSKGSLRKSVQVSGCSLCGDCKHDSPQWKTSGKQRQNSTSPRPEQPTVEVKFKDENTVTDTSGKIIVWIDQYPKVTLCDVAQKCHSFSPDCGYMLPDVVKTKAVRCFKQDMRAGLQFRHDCLGNNEHKNEEGALAKNRRFCSRVQSEMSICQSQRDLKERADAQTLPNQKTCWTSESSATSSASFLLGKHAKKREWNTGMWERGVGEDPGPRPHLIGAEIRTDKRIKLGDSAENGVSLSTLHSESISCKSQEKNDSDKGIKWISDDSHYCSEHAVEGSSIYTSVVKENHTFKTPCGEIHSPTKPNAAQMSSELFCERNQVDTDELESFTCQRVRVYIRKNNFSCARTYMSWPFSNRGSTLTAHAGTTACPAEPVVSSDKSYSTINQNQPGSPRSRTNDMITDSPTGPPSDTTQQLTHLNEEKREEDGESILAERNDKRHGNMSSYCSDSKNMEFAPHLSEAAESPASPPLGTATHSSPIQHVTGPGTDAASASSLPVNGPQTDSSYSTPSPSALGLTDWETATTLSSMSSPFTHGSFSVLSHTTPSLPPALFLPRKLYCEESQMRSCSSSPFATQHNSDSSQSWKSSLLLPQDEKQSDEEPLTYRCPPELEPYYYTSPINRDLVKERPLHNVHTGKCIETELMLPPMLSPVTSPEGRSRTNFLPENQDCPDEGDNEEEEEEISKGTCKRKMLPEFYLPSIVNNNKQNSKDYPQHCIKELEGVSTNFKNLTTPREPQSSPGSDEDVDDGNKEENQDETDWAHDVANKKSEQVPSDPKIKATLTTGVLAEPCSSPSSDDDDYGVVSDEELSTRVEGSRSSETAGNERDQTKEEAADDTLQGILDEFTAYKQDILLVDVIQDDPELFGNLPKKSLLNLGPTRVSETPKTGHIGVVKTFPRMDGTSLELEQRLRPINIELSCNSPDITEESNDRPWRPQCSSTPSKKQSNTCPATENQTKNMGQSDANNNHGNGSLERNQPIQTVNSQHNHIPPLMTIKNGPWITNPANTAEFRRQKSNAYCRLYFSESMSCGFKLCRFQHVPVEGDEKFCIETVTRFIKNPMCLQKAGAVFTGYYQNNPPGVYFSMPVFLSLLWALLKAGMVSDVFSVLSISVAHKIVPGHEFVLALFNLVREKSLMGFVPELMQLTYKMASAGLVLSLDCLDCVKNTPEVQQTVYPNSLASVSGNHKLSTSEPLPDDLNLAHVIVEIELCTKQEDWRRMGEIFRRICQSSQRPNEVERISGRIAIVLLSESKDKRSLPFAAFAETVCQSEDDDSLMKSFLGRIGVSLMLRYHKTHQWAKGRRVVEVLSLSKVKYSTLKGLFGNEDGASRCCLVTVATELFLLSGSVEGALNILRENDWFLSSCAWPCEPADLESRIRVLIRLAEKTSHRDTLDVLCNLPGLKEPNDSVDISRYCPLFNSHLQVCVDRQTLPVATDTVDFMLSKNLAVDPPMLQSLLHKLGKQNLWLRAREVFRHSLSVGYYPGVSAPSGLMALIVPCRLREVELALAFEMFITVNASAILQLSETTTDSLSIILKRTQSCESEYLSAGSRLLSAACIPQPKLIIHYTTVNSSKEQVFTLDVSSARCWLRHNHLWANEVWAHWT